VRWQVALTAPLLVPAAKVLPSSPRLGLLPMLLSHCINVMWSARGGLPPTTLVPVPARAAWPVLQPLLLLVPMRRGHIAQGVFAPRLPLAHTLACLLWVSGGSLRPLLPGAVFNGHPCTGCSALGTTGHKPLPRPSPCGAMMLKPPNTATAPLKLVARRRRTASLHSTQSTPEHALHGSTRT
jgi:hypothetical protein